MKDPAGELADQMAREQLAEEQRNERDFQRTAEQTRYQITEGAATVVDDVRPTAVSASDYAKALRRIDELTFAVQRILNALEQGCPHLAMQVARQELNLKPH